MKPGRLLVAALVLAALTGALYWSNHRKPAESSASASVDTPPKILALNPADISGIEIKKKGEKSVMLAKNDAGNWYITAPKSLRADQGSVSSVLSALSSLNSERLIEEKAGSLEAYGLDQPSIEVDVTEKNKKTHKLLIGDETPAGGAPYVAVAGDPRVFTVANYNKRSFDKSATDLRDKRLLMFDSDKLSSVELTAKKQRVEFARNKDRWQIVKPGPFRPDQFQVEELLRTLKDAKMDLSSTDDEKKAAAVFKAGTLIATAKVTDVSGAQELQIRESRDDYYAKSSVVDGVHKILSGTATGLDKSLDDFRNKKLFDFGFTDPEKVEMRDGANSYVLTRSGADWSSNGAKMDPGGVTALLDKLRDLSASKFLQSGFSSPALDITVTSKEGKNVERVLIAKGKDRYIAKRENEPALYELSVPSVTELQKTAAEMKPAVAPKK